MPSYIIARTYDTIGLKYVLNVQSKTATRHFGRMSNPWF